LSFLQVTHHRFVVHGLAAAVRCAVPQLSARIEQDLQSLAVASWPAGTTPVCGTIAPYCIDEVQRQLPTQATLVGRTEQNAEIYRADERFWIIDDQRGIVEINPLRGTWRSWILADQGWFPATQSAPLEFALIWPAAQLLRNRELFILPALSVAREGWGMLVICPFGLASDIQPMLAAGFRLVGPRWTAMREDDDRLSLLHLPGTVQQTCSAAKRLLATRIQNIGTKPKRLSLNDGSPNDDAASAVPAAQYQNFCDSVLIVEPTRRPVPQLRAVPPAHAPAALRRAWPMTELHPHRRQGRLPALLARHCQIFEAQLTPDPKHLLRFANAMRLGLAEGVAVRAGSAGKAGAGLAVSAGIVVSTTAVARGRPAIAPTETAALASSVAARVGPRPAPVPGQYRQRLMGRIRPPTAQVPTDKPRGAQSPPWSKAG
jgi:hypothetical protein